MANVAVPTLIWPSPLLDQGVSVRAIDGAERWSAWSRQRFAFDRGISYPLIM